MTLTSVVAILGIQNGSNCLMAVFFERIVAVPFTNPSDTILKKLPTGGPKSTTANVKFTTKVMKDGKAATYVVNLTKDLGITVNGIYVKSYWKYNVTPNVVTLLEDLNNDNLPKAMK